MGYIVVFLSRFVSVLSNEYEARVFCEMWLQEELEVCKSAVSNRIKWGCMCIRPCLYVYGTTALWNAKHSLTGYMQRFLWSWSSLYNLLWRLVRWLIIFTCKTGRRKRLRTVLFTWEKDFLSSTLLSGICCSKILLLPAMAVLSCNSLVGSRACCLIFQLFVLYY